METQASSESCRDIDCFVSRCCRSSHIIPGIFLSIQVLTISFAAFNNRSFLSAPLFLFFGLAFDGTNALVSANSHFFSVEKKVLVSLPSCLRGNIEQYHMLDLLHDSGYVMSLGYFACSRAHEFHWCRCCPSRCPYDFDTGEISCMPAIVEQVRKPQSDVTVLAELILPAIVRRSCSCYGQLKAM